jgi:hypothetical protein
LSYRIGFFRQSDAVTLGDVAELVNQFAKRGSAGFLAKLSFVANVSEVIERSVIAVNSTGSHSVTRDLLPSDQRRDVSAMRLDRSCFKVAALAVERGRHMSPPRWGLVSAVRPRKQALDP